MKIARRRLHPRLHVLPAIRFDHEAITSYAGSVLYQQLFRLLGLNERLRRCFRHLAKGSCYGLTALVRLLIVHLLLGFRELREIAYYEDDPLILRLLGLRQIPDVSTLSRELRHADPNSVWWLRQMSRNLVLERLRSLHPARLTVDFDGTVLWTYGRKTEGTAMGFNKAKKGARSYYPFFATVVQTGQVLDLLHRPGNIHDSNQALSLIESTFEILRDEFPTTVLEARLDSAHFNDDELFFMDDRGVEFSVSVPFERFTQLKGIIQRRRRWRRIDDTWSFFEMTWKPKSWSRSLRFVFYRQKSPIPRRGLVQLDLFEPRDFQYEYKVVATNKTLPAAKLLWFHNGRGAQEGIFAELKSQVQMDYLATRRLLGNQIFTFSAVIAHNLDRELQMRTRPMDRGTTQKRAALWIFEKAETLRRTLVCRAGRLTWPQGGLTLTLGDNPTVEKQLTQMLGALDYPSPIIGRRSPRRRQVRRRA